ncbi:MAG TPA: hypothetical protein PKI62_11315 [bacterium]|nr:hypothetical protein [bacterium]HPR87997.1 hypothetical protein [bacterium]
MAGISIYLNFPNQTEEAFTFYKYFFNMELHGAIRDRYGVQWMFNSAAKE